MLQQQSKDVQVKHIKTTTKWRLHCKKHVRTYLLQFDGWFTTIVDFNEIKERENGRLIRREDNIGFEAVLFGLESLQLLIKFRENRNTVFVT